MPDGENSRESVAPAAASSEESVKSAAFPARKEWTDGKHNLYLSSMESSFLFRFFNSNSCSVDLPGCSPVITPQQPTNSLSSSSNCMIACQFQFLRSGQRETLKFDSRAQLEVKEETRQLFENPWVKHFTPRSRPLNQVDSDELQSRRIQYFGKSTSQSPQQMYGAPRMRHQDTSTGSNAAEMSDQNFMDANSDTENRTRLHTRKRVKTEHVKSPVKDM